MDRSSSSTPSGDRTGKLGGDGVGPPPVPAPGTGPQPAFPGAPEPVSAPPPTGLGADLGTGLVTGLGTGPVPVEPGPVPEPPRQKIRVFEQKLGGGHQDKGWKRPTNVTGVGAVHVKSFHCKLTGDSLDFLDRQINEWLDEHPEYEVKLVTTTVGEWTGKLKEPALIVNVWV